MKHASSRELFDYWNNRRGSHAAPERADIEPAAIRKALGDIFILGCDARCPLTFRLAGTRVCALFCRELRDELFVGIWDEDERALVTDLITAVAEEAVAIVAGATARTAEGFKTDLECLILPLRGRAGTRSRMIGVLAPASIPIWLGDRPINSLRLSSFRHLDTASAQPAVVGLRPAGKPRRGLVVYDGGRS